MTNSKNAPRVGFVTFGEINTPFERLQKKHDEASCLGVISGEDHHAMRRKYFSRFSPAMPSMALSS